MDTINDSILFLLGLGVFGGMLGAWFFQKIRFPQVVGYIAIGLIIGQAGFGIINSEVVLQLKTFNLFALGIIGFLVGGELKMDTFRKYARQFTAILFGEGLLSFLLVGLASFLLIFLVTRNVTAASAGAVVLGAIASATDPASTIDVIWEYRSKGVMTTAIIAIVALDDALAMTLYGLGGSTAKLLASESGSIWLSLGHIANELFGSLVVGAAVAALLAAFLRWVPQTERGAAIAIGMILLVISVAVFFKMDIILATMMMGFVLTNFSPRRSKDLFKLMRSFSVPIYVLFFVLVGARLSFREMPGWLWLIIAAYIIGRCAGKFFGSYFGAKMTGSSPAVCKYLGLGLFAQGGVAIGLSIMAAEQLSPITIAGGMNLGDMVIFVVTTTTLVVQVLGPAMVKLAVRLSGEAGRDITEEDVRASMKVADVIDEKLTTLSEAAPVSEAINCFTENNVLMTPVVNKNGKITGILTFEALKDIIGDRDSWHWLLVADIMRPLEDSTTADANLDEIYERMYRLKIDQMPVVDSERGGIPLGMLDMRTIRLKVHAELLKRGEQTDMQAATA
ncbi:MAG: cation:proton antiporter [Victivallaceae bacterium]|nr:cation:proton antiporter [Victivallaceae bacterium]